MGMSQMTNRLSMPQQYALLGYARIGMKVLDALICCGVKPSDAEQMARDPFILEIHRAGRADGVRDLRSGLAAAAKLGNVSAMKALRMHETPGEETVEDVTRERVPRFNVLPSVRKAFARQKQLMEQGPDEADE